MQPFTTVTAVAAPLVRANVDTDAIIPSRHIKTVGRTGLAAGLFAGWRYRDAQGGSPNPDFVLNQAPYSNARILLGGENFGCGSSREHAVWALVEYGFRAVLAPSFAPIFFGNSIRNGLLPVVLPASCIGEIEAVVRDDPGENAVTVDLIRCQVSAPGVGPFPFDLEPQAREMLLEGLDSVGMALKNRPAIEDFIERDARARPWIYLT
ncbi:MAG: 3-isopropylmalate dehydratase small subunit [Proteobacteria bacterium]|nr:3-isopropylmalate dehydratase small subunit [Pseudomonadota bacterium]